MKWKSIRRFSSIGVSCRSIAGLFTSLLVLSIMQSSWFMLYYTMGPNMSIQQSSISSEFYFSSLDMSLKRSNLNSRNATKWMTMNKDRSNKSRNSFLPNITGILQHTICPSTSPLLSALSERTNYSLGDRARELRQWTVRLIYAVLFEHQYQPALDEAMNDSIYLNAPMWDDPPSYRCSTAKFLVIALSKNGLGANIRLGAIPALQIGLASNRVVLFLNDVSAGPKFFQEPWPLTSCRTSRNDSFPFIYPRNDYHCFFRPISPCTVTDDELNDAHVLKRSELRHLFRSGALHDEHKNDRVLIAHFPFRPQRQPENLPSLLHEKAREWIRRYSMQPKDAQIASSEFLYKAADLILQHEVSEDIMPPTKVPFSYYGINSIIHQSFLLYALRPNRWAMEHLSTIRHHLSAQYPGLSSQHPVGVPIRGSDKCETESECLTFRQYMDAAKESWANSREVNSSLFSSVVITTESQQVLDELTQYASEISLSTEDQATFPVHFITNPFDVAQDTGYFGASISGSQYSSNQIMVSSISSLQLQLQARYTLGNCCSNFHLMLKDLISIGCGSHPFQTFQCLQDHSNPFYRICCSWDKSAECIARRQTAVELTDVE